MNNRYKSKMHNMDEDELEQLRNVLLEQIERGLQPHLPDLMQIADDIREKRARTTNPHFFETFEPEAIMNINDDEPEVQPHPGLRCDLNYSKRGFFKRFVLINDVL